MHKLLAALALALVSTAHAETIAPVVVIENRFENAEGLAFSAEGRLYMAAEKGLHEVSVDGATRKIAAFDSNLGLAAIGRRDILMADFGPTAFPQTGPGNDDGAVWRVTPEGAVTKIAARIGDPNAIVRLRNGDLLVSDDFTNDIYRIDSRGAVSVFSDAIAFPNGLALSPDGRWLYVAQIFESAPAGPFPARFTEFSDKVWRLPLRNGKPAGPPVLVFRTGAPSGPDGLAFDRRGRLYLSAARAGQLWRIDPKTGAGELLADNLPGLASLAFGRGAFDRRSLYATQIRGGRLLRFPVDVEGAALSAGR